MKISATGNNGSMPIIWLDGGIHGGFACTVLCYVFQYELYANNVTLFLAREWISTATVTYIANEIITRAVAGDKNDIVNKVDWYVVPNLNPDGYEYSFTSDRLWRKTRSKIANSTCYGVGKQITDLQIFLDNLQFAEVTLPAGLLKALLRNWSRNAIEKHIIINIKPTNFKLN